jgi:hypothetical protein
VVLVVVVVVVVVLVVLVDLPLSLIPEISLPVAGEEVEELVLVEMPDHLEVLIWEMPEQQHQFQLQQTSQLLKEQTIQLLYLQEVL